jgi:hypothetical protein
MPDAEMTPEAAVANRNRSKVWSFLPPVPFLLSPSLRRPELSIFPSPIPT